jgi:Protein of unknown function (DUF3631)
MSNFNLPPGLAEAERAAFEDFPPVDGNRLLNDVSQFIGRYLQCSEHQRTVLALWALHTHCMSAAQVTPYLAIQSAEKQSGKTLCLQLLNLLCNDPALTSSFTANTLSRRIDAAVPAILLDECQAIVGTRNRSKGPALRAILASSYHCGIGYTDATHERNLFAPKAFAGMGQLPEALADRSIPIILRPLKKRVPNITVKSDAAGLRAAAAATEPKKSESERKLAGGLERSDKTCNVQRFNLTRAAEQAKSLQDKLHNWAEDNELDLEDKPSCSDEDFPPNLSPRRQDMIEPLLQLADHIGAEWPARIREALAAVFLQEAAFDLAHSLQLLADVRDCFAYYGYPDRLSTAALLAWMHMRPARPWDVDGPITARTFARLLMPFEIRPRVQRIGKDDPARGYQLEDFIEHWQTHFSFDPAVVTRARQSEIANNDAGCNAVTDSRAVSNSPAASPVFTAKSNGKTADHIEEFPERQPIGPQKVPGNDFQSSTVQQSGC